MYYFLNIVFVLLYQFIYKHRYITIKCILNEQKQLVTTNTNKIKPKMRTNKQNKT